MIDAGDAGVEIERRADGGYRPQPGVPHFGGEAQTQVAAEGESEQQDPLEARELPAVEHPAQIAPQAGAVEVGAATVGSSQVESQGRDPELVGAVSSI